MAYGFFLLLLDALAVGTLLGDVVVGVCLDSSCWTVLIGFAVGWGFAWTILLSKCIFASFVVVCEVVVVDWSTELSSVL